MSFDLERTIVIRATRETVFRYFTDSARFAAWWGDGSHIDPRPGGAVYIRYPNAVVALGEVRDIDPPARIRFTFGYESGQPIGPGASLVTVTLRDTPDGTLLQLVHELPDAASRDAHVPGWRYQLSVFSHVVTREQHQGLTGVVDRYFAAWTETDPVRRRELLAAAVTDDVSFRDPYGVVDGVDELALHIAGIQHHMAGVRPVREGDPSACQGSALVRWTARGDGDRLFGSGTNALDLAPDGRIRRVVGFWGA
jgi:uncharacterized protein YndB with AHSA1/START domain